MYHIIAFGGFTVSRNSFEARRLVIAMKTKGWYLQNQIVTEFAKTGLMGTNTEIHFLPVDESHTHALSQRHQAIETGWPGLLFQAAFFRRCKTTRVHFMACVAPEGH